MVTINPNLIKSPPSPLRIGLIGSRLTVALYLLVVRFQFPVSFTVNGIIYLSVLGVAGQVDQAATNSAFVTDVFLFVCGVVSATVNMRASALSDGPRPVLTAASCVHSIVIVGLGSLIWWLLIAVYPLFFVMGRESFPLGVDSWIFILFAWVAYDGVGHFIGGLTRYIGSTQRRAFMFMGAIPLDICAIGTSVTWLVLALVHKSGYLPPMHPAFYLLGLTSLTVIASDWPSTASGHIRRVG